MRGRVWVVCFLENSVPTKLQPTSHSLGNKLSISSLRKVGESRRGQPPPGRPLGQAPAVPSQRPGCEAHRELWRLLPPFWGKAMDWDSSEILFLEETVPPSPLTWCCNLVYNRPSIFAAYFSKTVITWSHLSRAWACSQSRKDKATNFDTAWLIMEVCPGFR